MTLPAHINLADLVLRVQSALLERTGFSVIRLGDGEGLVLCFDDAGVDVDEKWRNKQTHWFGHQHPSYQDWVLIRTEFRAAILSSDVLGMPRPFQLEKDIGYRVIPDKVLSMLHGVEPQFVVSDNNLHWFLQWTGALGLLMKSAERVHVIGCRDVAAGLSQALGLSSVNCILVRGEDPFPNIVQEQHWPDGYRTVKTAITNFMPGDLVLVGAGPLGKIYCNLAKARGAVALDVGSVIDGWAGVESRADIGTGPLTSLFTVASLADHPRTAKEVRSRLLSIISDTRFTDGFY